MASNTGTVGCNAISNGTERQLMRAEKQFMRNTNMNKGQCIHILLFLSEPYRYMYVGKERKPLMYSGRSPSSFHVYFKNLTQHAGIII
jgi:hypothetical protein